MKKVTKIVTSLLIVTILFTIFYSCKKNHEETLQKNLKVDRASIAKEIALHSRGLTDVINSFKKSQPFMKFAGLPPVTTPPVTVSPVVEEAYTDAENTIHTFLVNNNLIDYSSTVNLYLDKPNQPSISTISLQTNSFTYSSQFYIIGQDIINVDGDNLTVITQNINSILSSNNFLSLSEMEQVILIVGAETYLDSFGHWSTNDDWKQILLSANRINNKSSINKIAGSAGGSWGPSKWRTYAKADAIGGVGGAIAGALGGAAVGAIFTGGLGAGPGALQGAVRGGVTGAVGASIGKALFELFPNEVVFKPLLVEEQILINGVIAPKVWDLLPTTPLN